MNINSYFVNCKDTLKLFQDAVDSDIRSSFNPMPSSNDFAEDVTKIFRSNTAHRAAVIGYSGGERYVFYLFRSKDGKIYYIWTHDDTVNVML